MRCIELFGVGGCVHSGSSVSSRNIMYEGGV